MHQGDREAPSTGNKEVLSTGNKEAPSTGNSHLQATRRHHLQAFIPIRFEAIIKTCVGASSPMFKLGQMPPGSLIKVKSKHHLQSSN